MMRVKALATDVDGTITDSRKRISHEAIRAIRTLEENGIPVILTSGNPLCVLKTLRDYLGCSGGLICEDGAVVEYKDEVKILGNKDEVLKALRRLKDLYGNMVSESWLNPYRYVDVALRKTIDRSLILKVLVDYPHLKLLDSGFAYHIMNRKLSKATGLTLLAELMGISMKEIAAVGDSIPDLEMLEAAGYSFAVANAPEPLKSVASHVTEKEDGEGFVEAAETIISRLRKT